MSQNAFAWSRQRMSWAALNGLHPTPIDLGRTALIREADIDALSNPQWLESLLLRPGLNDEALNEFPGELHAHCGHGLRIWQYPTQFSKYLTQLSHLKIRSYLEIGIRHGGSFVTTAEYLHRFHSLDFAVGVDLIACPSMAGYHSPKVTGQVWCITL